MLSFIKKAVSLISVIIILVLSFSRGMPYLDDVIGYGILFSTCAALCGLPDGTVVNNKENDSLTGLSAGGYKENESSTQGSVQGEKITGKIKTVCLDSKGGNTFIDNVYLNNRTSQKLDLNEIINMDSKTKLKKNGEPQVLIVHTHATESYSSDGKSGETRSDDNEKNVTAVGSVLAGELNTAGIKTLHDKTHHDTPAFNGSYSRAEETIRTYLKKYPTIQMVIDLHRDSIDSDGLCVKPTVKIGKKNAAQIMFVTGCGNDSAPFEGWKNNLNIVLRLQNSIETDYSGLVRPVYFVGYRYNLHLTPASLLIEFGTEGNTLDEAKYSAVLAAKEIIKVLS